MLNLERVPSKIFNNKEKNKIKRRIDWFFYKYFNFCWSECDYFFLPEFQFWYRKHFIPYKYFVWAQKNTDAIFIMKFFYLTSKFNGMRSISQHMWITSKSCTFVKFDIFSGEMITAKQSYTLYFCNNCEILYL